MKNSDLGVTQTIDEGPDVTMKAILVDDEKSSLRSLSYELNAYCPEVTVVAQCQNPVQAVKEIKTHQPDIVFLDIEMPGMNGFELLQQFSEIDFDVIFVTAYDRFAMKAFDFNAVDYVLKPVRKAKLVQAVQKAAERQNHGITPSDLEALFQNINVQVQQGIIQNIALPTMEGFSMVDINDICYLMSDSNYTWVFLADQKKYLVSKTLKEFVGMLNFPQFFRAHKSYFVNLNYLDRFVRGQGGYLVMKDGTEISVSRANRAELMRVLNI